MAIEDRSTAAGATNPPIPTDANPAEYSPAGVFGTAGATSTADQGSTSTAASGLTPATGGGTDANDATITLSAGAGLDGGGSFTTNQADPATIALSLPTVIDSMT